MSSFDLFIRFSLKIVAGGYKLQSWFVRISTEIILYYSLIITINKT